MLKPFEENLEKVRAASAHCTEGILESDIFVLISDPEGTDMYAELGVALAENTRAHGRPRIYVVGEHGRRSVMQLHPAVTHVDALQAVFQKEGVTTDGVQMPEFE
jgi:hypothetical protein